MVRASVETAAAAAADDDDDDDDDDGDATRHDSTAAHPGHLLFINTDYCSRTKLVCYHHHESASALFTT